MYVVPQMLTGIRAAILSISTGIVTNVEEEAAAITY